MMPLISPSRYLAARNLMLEHPDQSIPGVLTAHRCNGSSLRALAAQVSFHLWHPDIKSLIGHSSVCAEVNCVLQAVIKDNTQSLSHFRQAFTEASSQTLTIHPHRLAHRARWNPHGTQAAILCNDHDDRRLTSLPFIQDVVNAIAPSNHIRDAERIALDNVWTRTAQYLQPPIDGKPSAPKKGLADVYAFPSP